jgi:hypothetical protein
MATATRGATRVARAAALGVTSLALASGAHVSAGGMGAPTRGATRIARAAAFGVATLTLAIGAHVMAGGALPSLMVLMSLALPLTVGALILTRRRCGPLLLLGSLAAAQVLLHETLGVLAGHAPAGLASAQPGAGHGAHVLLFGPMAAHTTSAMDSGMGAALPGTGGWSITMTAAHVLATVVTALLLARGEQALWQLVARLLPRLPCIPRLFSCGPRRASVLLSVPALRPCLVSGGPGLRGPPAGFLATA